LGDVSVVIKDRKIVAGAGAIEMELSRKLKEFANTLSGREQLAVMEFANSLEFIPSTLAENGGLDPIDVLTELKSKHDKGEKYAGINLLTNKIENVLEAGVGSGSLTTALASIVAPTGNVVSYDIREDFIEHAMKNLKTTGLEKYVKILEKDVTKGISEKNLDAIILDIPNPWDAVGHTYKSLKVGGYLCCYSPLVSQLELTVKEMRKHSFIEIKTFENIQRDKIIGERGTRPRLNMLGHTGYLTFARKVLL
jgi:protein-L-isoaspartate O-methyltransferase